MFANERRRAFMFIDALTQVPTGEGEHNLHRTGHI